MTATKIPQRAVRESQIVHLSHDNVCQGDYSIQISEGTVWLTRQAWGKMPTEKIAVPRKTFDAFVAWYTTGKVPRGDKASRTPPKDRA